MKRLSISFIAIFLLATISQAQPGTWKQIGDNGIWANTVFAASSKGTLYSIEKSGALYKTDPTTGAYALISNQYSNTVGLLAGDNIYTIEKNGSLYEININ